jgi:hypothetical protein
MSRPNNNMTRHKYFEGLEALRNGCRLPPPSALVIPCTNIFLAVDASIARKVTLKQLTYWYQGYFRR